jgi:hypothetical protein
VEEEGGGEEEDGRREGGKEGRRLVGNLKGGREGK